MCLSDGEPVTAPRLSPGVGDYFFNRVQIES